MNGFFIKMYNIAFRLTGDEVKAEEMAFIAINCILPKEDMNDIISDSILRRTAEEICRMFLSDNISDVKKFERNNSKEELLQAALMSLEPSGRMIIVWRDILGFKIDDMTGINCNKQKMYYELNSARRQMKEILCDNALLSGSINEEVKGEK